MSTFGRSRANYDDASEVHVAYFSMRYTIFATDSILLYFLQVLLLPVWGSAMSNGCSAWRALGTAKTVTRVP